MYQGSFLKSGRNTERGGKKGGLRLLAVTGDALFLSLSGAALPVRSACSGPNMPNLGSLYVLL